MSTESSTPATESATSTPRTSTSPTSTPINSTLYRGGVVHCPTGTPATGTAAMGPTASAMVVTGGHIGWIGSDDEAARHADGVGEVVELNGALVTPTFVDAHVHISQTGMGLRSVGLDDVFSVSEALARIEVVARRRQGRPIYAPNWDEDGWIDQRPPTARELDRATYGGVVYSPRVDGHSAVISSALAAASGARNLPGWNDSGLVTREAHHAARDAFRDGVSPSDRRADIDAALEAAAAAGIGLLHENAGPHLSSVQDLADVLAAGERGDGPQVIGYWGELVADETQARELARLHRVHGLAGDLNVDGSIGSRTAALRARYSDLADISGGAGIPGGPDGPAGSAADNAGPELSGQCGNAYLSVEQVRDHVSACSLAGIQAGFHVIGDAGADTVVEGMQAAAAQVGAACVAAGRHRLEHLEMIDAAGIKALAELGVTASVQPMFDAMWGGHDSMYVARLGPDRAKAMNAFGSMAAAGLTLAFGSDTPVTPFAPWQAIRAAAFHHEPSQRISVAAAFQAHTRGGWQAAGIDGHGYLGQGQPASFAIWSVGGDASGAGPPGSPGHPGSPGLPDLTPGATLPTNLRTVIRGRTVFAREGALS